MSLYLNNNSQMVYNILKNTLGRFKGHYTCNEIEDAVTEFFTNEMESTIRQGDKGRNDVADLLNKFCAMIVWLKDYTLSNELANETQVRDTIKIALFNFGLGEAPEHNSVFPSDTKSYLEKAQKVDPHEDLPFLPTGLGGGNK